MGTIIQATAIHADPTLHSSIQLAAKAGKLCIEKANIEASDIDVLINVGIFRDQNIVEPAIAALVQKELGMHLDYINQKVRKPALSFDLLNSACGVVNAMQVADAMLSAGRAKRVLLVASDAHPSMKPDPQFPYASVGAAMLFTSSPDPNRGFQGFAFRSSPTDDGARSVVDLSPNQQVRGRDRISLVRDEQYPNALRQFALEVAKDFLASRSLVPSAVKLLAYPASHEIPESLAQGLGLALPGLPRPGREGYTAALPSAYHEARSAGLLADNEPVLWVVGGLGLTVACALYVP